MDMEMKKEITKRWQQANRDKMKEYAKKWRTANLDIAKARDIQWQNDNRERAIEHRRKYNNTKIACECGSYISKGHLAAHNRTQKHIKFYQKEE